VSSAGQLKRHILTALSVTAHPRANYSDLSQAQPARHLKGVRARYACRVSRPADVPRTLSQHTNDIEALYELVSAVDGKVDALAESTAAGFAASAQRDAELRERLDLILSRLRGQ
jgi:hypothetical protein